MGEAIETRPLVPADEKELEDLVLELPVRLGEETGLSQILRAVRDHEGFVAVEDRALAGFLTYDRSDPRSAQITWLAGRPGERQTVLRSLVEGALRALEASGTEIVCAVVPADVPQRGEDAGHAATRSFYESLGFVPLCEVGSLDEATSDSLVLARSLSPR